MRVAGPSTIVYVSPVPERRHSCVSPDGPGDLASEPLAARKAEMQPLRMLRKKAAARVEVLHLAVRFHARANARHRFDFVPFRERDRLTRTARESFCMARICGPETDSSAHQVRNAVAVEIRSPCKGARVIREIEPAHAGCVTIACLFCFT